MKLLNQIVKEKQSSKLLTCTPPADPKSSMQTDLTASQAWFSCFSRIEEAQPFLHAVPLRS